MNWDFEEKLIKNFYPHKKGGGGGGGPSAKQVRESDARLEAAKLDFSQRSAAQEVSFTSRISDLRQASKDQITNLQASFGSQLEVAESARMAIATQNRSLSQRIAAQGVGSSATGATPVRTRSSAGAFSQFSRKSRGRSSNIQKSSGGKSTLGSQIKF